MLFLKWKDNIHMYTSIASNLSDLHLDITMNIWERSRMQNIWGDEECRYDKAHAKSLRILVLSAQVKGTSTYTSNLCTQTLEHDIHTYLIVMQGMKK